jgi:hypothetical protein
MVAFRAGPVFAAALKLTVPAPDPLAPPAICSHPALETAVHEQLASADSAKLPAPPAASSSSDVGLIEYEQAAACWIVKDCPAMFKVADRGAPDAFASTANCTVPSPLPLAPDVTRTHDSAVDAVHEQLPAALTLTPPVPPSAPKLADVALSE